MLAFSSWSVSSFETLVSFSSPSISDDAFDCLADAYEQSSLLICKKVREVPWFLPQDTFNIYNFKNVLNTAIFFRKVL